MEFVDFVTQLRGEEWEDLEPLAQGDSGQLWFKLSLSLISRTELEDVQEGKKGAKKRRVMDDGVQGGTKFHSWGVNKMLILAVVQGVPECNHNLGIILVQIAFKCPSSN